MKKDWTLTQKLFDSLLNWLDEDPETAGAKYQKIRERLLKIFISRGFSEAEDLTDEVFNRVASKIETISETYTGDRTYYFHGVASKILLEAARKRETALNESITQNPQQTVKYDDNPKLDCLNECLGKLPPEQYKLILGYYQVEKSGKVDQRVFLAEKFGLTLNNLRVQVCRIRTKLKICIEECAA
jgi:RNA polymerase sigma factor (sigma-70 family)